MRYRWISLLAGAAVFFILARGISNVIGFNTVKVPYIGPLNLSELCYLLCALFAVFGIAELVQWLIDRFDRKQGP